MDTTNIEYHGNERSTSSCLKAIVNLYDLDTIFNSCILLSSPEQHAFIVSMETEKTVVIRGGFTSGYNGEGPRGLATALRFFEMLDVSMSEVDVTVGVMNKLNSSALGRREIKKIFQSKTCRHLSWHTYIDDYQLDRNDRKTEFRKLFEFELPLRIVDIRILDLALNLPENPDATLMSCYRRLEDTLRQRCDLPGEHGVRLTKKIFLGENRRLTWPGLEEGEIVGRANLFSAIFTAFRNTRAHKEIHHQAGNYIREFLLINELYVLESEAIAVTFSAHSDAGLTEA